MEVLLPLTPQIKPPKAPQQQQDRRFSAGAPQPSSEGRENIKTQLRQPHAKENEEESYSCKFEFISTYVPIHLVHCLFGKEGHYLPPCPLRIPAS